MENLNCRKASTFANHTDLVAEKITEIYFEKDKFKLSAGTNWFQLSWESQIDSQIQHPIKFEWRNIAFNLTVIGTYGQRSRTIEAKLEYSGQHYVFGIGQSTLGAGVIGKAPEIQVGNHRLKFSFGNRHIQISEQKISYDLKESIELIKPSFKFIL